MKTLSIICINRLTITRKKRRRFSKRRRNRRTIGRLKGDAVEESAIFDHHYALSVAPDNKRRAGPPLSRTAQRLFSFRDVGRRSFRRPFCTFLRPMPMLRLQRFGQNSAPRRPRSSVFSEIHLISCSGAFIGYKISAWRSLWKGSTFFIASTPYNRSIRHSPTTMKPHGAIYRPARVSKILACDRKGFGREAPASVCVKIPSPRRTRD